MGGRDRHRVLRCEGRVVGADHPRRIAGTAHLWLGPLPKRRRVRVAFCAPLVPPPEATPDAVAELVDRRLWPEVREEYGRLRATPA